MTTTMIAPVETAKVTDCPYAWCMKLDCLTGCDRISHQSRSSVAHSPGGDLTVEIYRADEPNETTGTQIEFGVRPWDSEADPTCLYLSPAEARDLATVLISASHELLTPGEPVGLFEDKAWAKWAPLSVEIETDRLIAGPWSGPIIAVSAKDTESQKPDLVRMDTGVAFLAARLLQMAADEVEASQ